MKKINNGFFSVSMLALLGFASCTNDVDQSYPLNTNKPTITITPSSATISEIDDSSTPDVNESVATFTVTTDRALNADMKFKLEIISGESTLSLDDFETSLDDSPIDFGIDGYVFILPRNQTTTTFTISGISDMFEGSEILKLRVFPVGTMDGLVAADSQILTLTLNNSADNLVLVIDWDKTFNYGGVDYTFCALSYDVDILVYDQNGDMFGAGAQTGDCPETLEMSLANYPNGTYTITGYLYDDGPDDIASAGISPPIDIPFNVAYSRAGSQTLENGGTFVQSTGFTTDTQVGAEVYIMTVVVSNGTFMIENNGAVIAAGRNAARLNHVE